MKAIPISFVSGILISMALFWLMQMMISNNQQGFKKTDTIKMTEFVRLKRETKLQIKDRKIPDEPPPPEKRPPPPQMEMQQVNKVQSNIPQMDMPNLNIPLQMDRFKGVQLSGLQVISKNVGGASIQAIPIHAAIPIYPTALGRSRNREGGRVKVEFTVNAQGIPENISVADRAPKSLSKKFNKAAMDAAKNSTFKPKMVNGVAIKITFHRVYNFTIPK